MTRPLGGRIDSEECHLACLAAPLILQPMPQAAGVAVVELLEHVQAATESDFPAGVGFDFSVVDGSGFVVLPVEVHAGDRSVVLDTLEKISLLVAPLLILDCLTSITLSGRRQLKWRVSELASC